MENTFPMIIRTMNIIPRNFIIAGNMNGNNILQRSFEEQKPKITKMTNQWSFSISTTSNSNRNYLNGSITIYQFVNKIPVMKRLLNYRVKVEGIGCRGEKDEDCGGHK